MATEREVKLTAGPDLRLPSLTGVADGVTAAPARRVRLEATYYDADDLRLARAGITLRHRSDEGWVLKLPRGARDGALSRRELRLEGEPGTPPARALELLRAHLRGDALSPVATLVTDRRRVRLRDGGGGELAEVADDRVTSRDRRGGTRSFRQVEVEMRPAGPDGLLTGVTDRLLAAGASAEPPRPKLVQALGDAALEPPEASAGRLPAEPTARELVRATIASAVGRYLDHDPGAALGEDPEEVHQAGVGLRRVRAALRARDLRYASEALTPVLRRPAARLAKRAKRLQSLLGDHQDAVVLRGWLHAASDGAPWRAAFAAGAVSEGRRAVIAESRAGVRRAYRRIDTSRRRVPR